MSVTRTSAGGGIIRIMAGLDFSSHAPPVDPDTPLRALFEEWVDTLAVTRSERTLAAYVQDFTLLGEQLLTVCTGGNVNAYIAAQPPWVAPDAPMP